VREEFARPLLSTASLSRRRSAVRISFGLQGRRCSSVSRRDRFVGAVSLHDIKNYLNTPELAELVIAEDIVRHGFPVVRPEASLAEAMEKFVQHDGERLPVVNNPTDTRLIGSISKTDVILALAGSTRSPATVRSADDE